MKMRKFRISAVVLIVFSTYLILQSCSNQNSCGTSNISSTGSTRSHNNGRNCMNCHVDGGEGKGCFNVAGSVYDSASKSTARTNGSVKLYTGINASGTLIATLQVDGKGNFFTTDNVNFVAPLFPVVVSSAGDVHYMPQSITIGQCGSCHGVSTGKIWVR